MTNSGEDIKVLIVEDNRTDYLLTERAFSGISSGKKIRLDWCQSYEDGLQALEKDGYDLYLLDYSLGANNGLDLIEESQKRGGTSGPFVLLSDYDAASMFERSVQLGVYDHILKQEISPSTLDRMLTYTLQRYKTERELKDEKTFNAFILAEIPYLVISVDQNSHIFSVNPAAEKLLGRPRTDLIGRPWKELLHEEDGADIKFKINDDGDVSFEARIVTPANEERIIHWHVLNKGTQKEEMAFILSGKDVTDEIRAEEAEHRRQKLEALGQLAGGVAHEINNLLQPILMSAQMVAAKAEQLAESDERAYTLKNMERIERNAKNAAKIVDDILLFSRGDQKETEVLDIYDVLQDVVSFVKEMLPATVSVVNNSHKPEDLFKANINKSEMTQIITNMLVNAAHAMDQKGEVNVEASNKQISTRLAQTMKIEPGNYVEIKIQDTGSGISEENIDKIFNPFFTTKDVGEGTGLGLSIVYKIIERWGGTIKVESKIGQGTTFYIYIPLC